MKNTLNIMALFALLLFAGCQDDEYVAPDSLSDVTWYSSIPHGDDVAVNQGYFISFMDASLNATSHTWTIEEGNNYLINGFDVNEKADSLLPSFINEEAGLSVSDPTIHVLFNNPGLNTVRLKNTFSEKVSFKGEFPLEAIKVGDEWVIDTSFVVDVYAEIEPSFLVKKENEDGVEEVLYTFNSGDEIPADSSLWKKITIESGEKLTFVDITEVGRPTDRWWYLEGASYEDGTSGGDSTRTASYYNMGLYSGQLKGIRKGDFPSAETEIQMPLFIETTQSSKLLEAVNSPKVQEDETIAITISGALVPFTDQEDFFTVIVNNADAWVVDKQVEVIAAARGAVKNEISLTLGEAIYNTDIVTVAYNNTGSTILSGDDRQLESFAAIEASNYYAGNYLNANWAGYEDYNSNWKSAFCVGYWVGNGNGSEADPIFGRNTERPFSGAASMKYTARDGVKAVSLAGEDFAGQLTEAGLYRVSFKLFIDTNTTMSTIRAVIQKPWTLLMWDFSDQPKGEWVTMSQDVMFDEVPSGKLNIQVKTTDGNNGSATGDQIFYLDDISFVPLQTRP
ncbi:hypothetical protein [Saccharicrinis aurantiacus]|uniref:hypothetical protein n=1 Tax=Saccharicrinis aurantiacus TaxID=1849719 RepID=UPI00094FC6A4|nr:hypothetical protein [Saccharicrinis aurantiacus]